MADVKVIKATVQSEENKTMLRVAAYCRVSTINEEQDSKQRNKILFDKLFNQ